MKQYLIGVVAMSLFIVPVGADAAFDTSLKYGARGAAVTELQEFLIDRGYMTGQATGNFYSLTLKGVKAFQVANGLPATGYFGPMSRTAASNLIAEDISASESEEVQTFGSVAPPSNTDSVDALNAKIAELNQKLADLNTKTTELTTKTEEQNTKIAEQTATIQEQNTTLTQIQQNTTPAPVVAPPPPREVVKEIKFRRQYCSGNGCGFEAQYVEDGVEKFGASITVTATDGRFEGCDTSSELSCTKVTTRSGYDHKAVAFINYYAESRGTRTLNVAANGATSTITVFIIGN